jgi:uncharacterized protein
VATDDLDTPLGQSKSKGRRFRIPVSVSQALAGVLGLIVATFAGWAVMANDPLGGEPMFVAPAIAVKGEMPAVVSLPEQGPRRYEGPGETRQATAPGQPANVVTIIDGSTGKRQVVPIAGPQSGGSGAEQRLLEATRHGAIPKIASDGQRPLEAYARAAKPDGKPNAPRIAIVVTGLGVSDNATQAALSKLPGPVTLAFAPYGFEINRTVSKARGDGHEVLLQIPMEPFDYPDNDPGPQTLLASLKPEQNIDRLHWLMSRFQGYVGVTNLMGARFTATEPAFAPVLREIGKRGLIYVDDGASHRSLAAQIARSDNVPFARVELTIDADPTPQKIDRALARLEALAKERGYAIGIASALPAAIERIAQWSKAATKRGIELVPISAVISRPGQS